MKTLKELEGDWNKTKGKLKQNFGTYTTNDLLVVKEKQDEVLGRLQVKLGKTKEEILKIIAEL